jgi:hypothetical protein
VGDRCAKVAAKTCDIDDEDQEHALHLETDEGLFRVVVPVHVWHKADLGFELRVPDGDLSQPEVAATITWPW